MKVVISFTEPAQRDMKKLTGQQQRQFTAAMRSKLIPAWENGIFPRGLGFKKMQGVPGDIWEARWAPDGRITWQYTDSGAIEIRAVLIRRVGTRDIYRQP